MITELTQKMIDRIDLTEQEARSAMEEIMAGQATDAQIAAFLIALRMKGETAPELIGFARVMREKAQPLWQGVPPEVLDTAGTGGSRCTCREAWKPFGKQQMRQRGRDGSSRDRHSNAGRSPSDSH